MRIISALTLAGAACGGIEGEPLEGTIQIEYGPSRPALVVGAAVAHRDAPGRMLVQLGSNHVDCDTYLDVLFSFTNPEGTFLYFTVDRAPGEYVDNSISAMVSENNSTKINVAFGSVTIDTVDPRVTGTVTMFETTDEEVGRIAASGTFDVVKCF